MYTYDRAFLLTNTTTAITITKTKTPPAPPPAIAMSSRMREAWKGGGGSKYIEKDLFVHCFSL